MRFFRIFLFIIPSLIYSQDEVNLSSLTIPSELTENANAVIRKNTINVLIENYDRVTVETDRIVTVLNESGASAVNAYENYDPYLKVRSIGAVIYDQLGKKVDKFKKSDFKDVSSVPNGSLYTDNRVLYLDYVPRAFPYTVHFKSTMVFKSTAFLPSWYPIENFYVSTESSELMVHNASDVKIRVLEENLEKYQSIKKEGLFYQASNLPAIRSEAYSPNFNTYAPHVLMTLEKFEMEGVDGYNKDWSSFGKWMNDRLLSTVGEIPEDLKHEIKNLTKDLASEREKAEVVYKFMQDRSRYISVQIGIGGWQPIDATEVHENAYGDCKGLSNYTKSLLNEVGIKANHAVIYGGRNIRDIKKDFSSTQGNHMILHIPELDDEKDIWLECTSKTSPFGFIAGFTDDRDALVISEQGGVIKHTTEYPAEASKQIINAQISLAKNGTAVGVLEMETTGYQFSFRDDMNSLTEKEVKESYQEQWDYLNDLRIKDAIISRDADSVVMRENITFEVGKVASKMGNILLLNTVLFNRNNYEPPSYDDRKLNLEISRGYVDEDTYEINLEEHMEIDALPENVALDTDFGSYTLEVESATPKKIKVKRYLKFNKGVFDRSRYSDYMEFRNAIVKADNSKAAIKI